MVLWCCEASLSRKGRHRGQCCCHGIRRRPRSRLCRGADEKWARHTMASDVVAQRRSRRMTTMGLSYNGHRCCRPGAGPGDDNASPRRTKLEMSSALDRAGGATTIGPVVRLGSSRGNMTVALVSCSASTTNSPRIGGIVARQVSFIERPGGGQFIAVRAGRHSTGPTPYMKSLLFPAGSPGGRGYLRSCRAPSPIPDNQYQRDQQQECACVTGRFCNPATPAVPLFCSLLDLLGLFGLLGLGNAVTTVAHEEIGNVQPTIGYANGGRAAHVVLRPHSSVEQFAIASVPLCIIATEHAQFRPVETLPTEKAIVISITGQVPRLRRSASTVGIHPPATKSRFIAVVLGFTATFLEEAERDPGIYQLVILKFTFLAEAFLVEY